jgi:hypothetical protein
VEGVAGDGRDGMRVPSYGVLYLSGQTSLLQGGAAQGGVKFQKYCAPNQPASAKRATPPKKHATNISALLLSSLRMGRCSRLSAKSYSTRHPSVIHKSAGLFCPYLSSVPSFSWGINLACRNIASSTYPVAAPTSSKPSAAASNNSAAFCQDCRAWAFSGRLSSMYTRATSLSVRSAGPSLTWIERVSGWTIRAGA